MQKKKQSFVGTVSILYKVTMNLIIIYIVSIFLAGPPLQHADDLINYVHKKYNTNKMSLESVPMKRKKANPYELLSLFKQ